MIPGIFLQKIFSFNGQAYEMITKPPDGKVAYDFPSVRDRQLVEEPQIPIFILKLTCAAPLCTILEYLPISLDVHGIV